MGKPKVKVVIGANYGDEGKGLATDYFAQKAKGPVLNVLYNGGPQRGHTVEHKNGLRHIFHHFGSGFFSGASTYFDENFLVDPIKFNIEHCELLDQARYFTDMTEEEANENSICFCHPNCRVITPWDAMANQILQKGNNTCGCGIWQTVDRYNNAPYAASFKAMCEMDDPTLKRYLKDISWYELFQIGMHHDDSTMAQINDALGDFKDIWFNEQFFDNFIYDIRQMASRVIFTSFEDIAEGIDTIIFEGGQGLSIGEQNGASLCHESTPSDTGSKIPIQLCRGISDDIEICYVTRTYVTRHGDGPLPYECKKEDLGINEIDITNQSNKFQGDLRYAYYNWDRLMNRVDQDYYMIDERSRKNIDKSLMITHYDPESFIMDTDRLTRFDDCYISASPYSEEVEVWRL